MPVTTAVAAGSAMRRHRIAVVAAGHLEAHTIGCGAKVATDSLWLPHMSSVVTTEAPSACMAVTAHARAHSVVWVIRVRVGHLTPQHLIRK